MPVAPSALIERLSDHDRARLGEAIQLLLAHGSILGLESGQGDMYAWCRQNLEWLREVGALVGLQITNEHENRLVQAIPLRPAMTLRLKQDAPLVLLALWYEYDTQVRDQGASEVVLTVESLNQLLKEKLLPDLKEPPSRGRLMEILRLAQRYNLVRLDVADATEDSTIEVLPTLKRVIPFQDLEDWTRTAQLHRGESEAADGAADEEISI